jgi:hypothetical protein
MKSQSISRPTHKTQLGRVVYDRKKHVFTLKDLMRIARTIELSADPLLLFESMGVIYSLLYRTLRRYAELVPGFSVWGQISGFIYEIISGLWDFVVTSGGAPSKPRKPI